MDHSFAYGNHFFPYNAQPPQFNLFCEPFSEHSLQQPPPCFQPYCEQPPNQYDELKQEELQSVQPWQPQFSDQWQQRIVASDFQEMTTQVAQMVAAIINWQGKLKRRRRQWSMKRYSEQPLPLRFKLTVIIMR
ncbi:hypothetical protein V8G54_037593 [Vigna mungo]|uniref:Uncharacterized protein n=1 Tax=Vigna mungo TaxID=3915 RepID=A0AAQ3MIV3_VIGMU